MDVDGAEVVGGREILEIRTAIAGLAPSVCTPANALGTWKVASLESGSVEVETPDIAAVDRGFPPVSERLVERPDFGSTKKDKTTALVDAANDTGAVGLTGLLGRGASGSTTLYAT